MRSKRQYLSGLVLATVAVAACTGLAFAWQDAGDQPAPAAGAMEYDFVRAGPFESPASLKAHVDRLGREGWSLPEVVVIQRGRGYWLLPPGFSQPSHEARLLVRRKK